MIGIKDSTEKIFLDLLVVPFNQIKDHVFLDIFLPNSDHKDEIKQILKQELYNFLYYHKNFTRK